MKISSSASTRSLIRCPIDIYVNKHRLTSRYRITSLTSCPNASLPISPHSPCSAASLYSISTRSVEISTASAATDRRPPRELAELRRCRSADRSASFVRMFLVYPSLGRTKRSRKRRNPAPQNRSRNAYSPAIPLSARLPTPPGGRRADHIPDARNMKPPPPKGGGTFVVSSAGSEILDFSRAHGHPSLRRWKGSIREAQARPWCLNLQSRARP